MPKHPITYLERFRLRAGFSKTELAFLMGAMESKSVRRHERGMQLPKLTTALGYAILLDTRVEDLCEGLILEVHSGLRSRARGLCRKLGKLPRTKKNIRKIEILGRIAAGRRNGSIDLTLQ